MSASPAADLACCTVLYGQPLVELLVGESFHPGGHAASRRLLTSARLSPGQRVLDAGCGLGATARLAALEFGLAVDACDVSGEAIRRAATIANDAGAAIRFTRASFLDLPYADGTFAGVLAECVLSTTSKSTALREMRRVIAPDGMVLVSDVVSSDHFEAPEPLGSVLCLTHAWRPGELEDEIVSAGFAVERTWDETTGLSDLIDRLEVRGTLLRTMARDASGPKGSRPPFADLLAGLGDVGRLANLLDEARRSVHEGRLRYIGLVARAV